MSESEISVVEISVSAAEAPRRAAEVTRWLLDTGVIDHNTERDDLWQPSRYRAGPRVLAVAPEFDYLTRRLSNNGVDVAVGRSVYHPVENYEPPDCPACGTTLDEDTHYGFVEPWLTGPEPLVICPACQGKSLLGDWIGHGDEYGQWTFQIGELGVSFNNWPALTTSFLTEIGDRIGPRWRVVSVHR